MSATPIAITGTGLITGVGLNAPATCAAIRCAIDNFQETRFMDNGGEWMLGSEVPMDPPIRGYGKLLRMATDAIHECIVGNKEINPESTPLLLCLPQHDRAGRVIKDDNQFFHELQDALGVEFNDKSRVIARGHVATAIALMHARKMIELDEVNHVLIASVDSLLVSASLRQFEDSGRLLTSNNSDGFVPGEAGAAIVVEPAGQKNGLQLICAGLGFAVENVHIHSEEPLRSDGLAEAIKEALTDAGMEIGDLDFKISSLSGEQYSFKETSLALLRLLRVRKHEFDIWHPADCTGEVGTPSSLIMLSVIRSAFEKGYSKGNRVLAEFANEDGKRAAMILIWKSLGGEHG